MIIGADAREEHVNEPSAAASRTERASAWSWVAAGLFIIGATGTHWTCRAAAGENWNAMVTLVFCFATSPRST